MFDADAEKALPVLSIGELRGFFDYYLSRFHHYKPRAGLDGDLCCQAGVPALLWEKGIKDAPRRPIIDRTIFVRLGGEAFDVTVQKNGVTCDSILYYADELLGIFTHSKNLRGKSGRQSTEYNATRDPNDLGRLWVHDPYRDVMIECQAVGRDAAYANGLKAYQHRRIRDYQLKRQREDEGNLGLMEAKQMLHKQMMALIEKGRKKVDPATKLARFYNDNEKLHSRGRVLAMAHVHAGDRMDILNPSKLMPAAVVNPNAVGVMPGSHAAPDAPVETFKELHGNPRPPEDVVAEKPAGKKRTKTAALPPADIAEDPADTTGNETADEVTVTSSIKDIAAKHEGWGE